MKFIYCLLLLFLPFAAYSQSKWRWQNPKPAAIFFSDVAFVDSLRGWAVGSHGALLSTNDGGKNWDLDQVASAASFTTIQFINSKQGWIAGADGTTLKTTDEGRTWLPASNGIPRRWGIQHSQFLDSLNGWAHGSNLLYLPDSADRFFRTQDGGENWQALNWSFNTEEVKGFYFLNPDTGFVIGYDGEIFRTLNGGGAWTQLNSGTTMELSAIHFQDRNNGWVLGGSGLMLRTSDGGMNWSRVDSITGYNLAGITFVDRMNGWIYGGGGFTAKSTDGGNTWRQIPTNTSDRITGLCGIASGKVWAVGGIGMVLSTDTNEAAWTINSSNQVTASFTSIKFLDPQTGFAVGTRGKMVKTTDGGKTWTEHATGIRDALFSLNSLGDSVFVAAGDSGRIYKTTNQGHTWKIKQTGSGMVVNSISFPNARIGYAANDSGKIFKTLDGGETWTLITRINTQYLQNIFFTSERVGYACNNDVFITQDGGTTWRRSSAGFFVYGSWFLNDSTGWVVGRNGISKTTDAGLTWVRQAALGGNENYLLAVQFLNDSVGWATGIPGLLFGTRNGGATWSRYSTGFSRMFYSICFTDTANGWIAGEFSSILKYGPLQIPSATRPFSSAPLLTAGPIIPNPSQGIFSLNLDNPARVEVLTMDGRRVLSLPSQPAGKLRVDLSGQPKGLYLVKLVGADGRRQVRKAVVE